MGRPWKHTIESLKPSEYFKVIDGPYHNIRPYPVWKCQCICGKEFFEQGNRINSGRRRSCGCLSVTNRLQKKYSDPQIAAYYRLALRYKYSCVSLKREWSLTTEQAIAMFKDNCYYCGSPPSKTTNVYITKRNKYRIKDLEWCQQAEVAFNGIDRIDSSKGYTLDNVVTCCSICNRAKSDMSYSDFMKWIQMLCQKHSSAYRTCMDT